MLLEHINMISEESFDAEDWHKAETSALPPVKIEKSYFKL